MILDQPFPLSSPDALNELAPRSLPLDPATKESWIKFHDAVDHSLKPEGSYRSARRTANKAAEQALRIAGVLAFSEDFESGDISLDVIDRAIELVHFYLDQALRIADTAISNPDLELGQAVLEWMKKKILQTEGKTTFSLQEIYQKARPRGVRNQKAAKRVMAVLEEHQVVERTHTEKFEWKLAEGVG